MYNLPCWIYSCPEEANIIQFRMVEAASAPFRISTNLFYRSKHASSFSPSAMLLAECLNAPEQLHSRIVYTRRPVSWPH